MTDKEIKFAQYLERKLNKDVKSIPNKTKKFLENGYDYATKHKISKVK